MNFFYTVNLFVLGKERRNKKKEKVTDKHLVGEEDEGFCDSDNTENGILLTSQHTKNKRSQYDKSLKPMEKKIIRKKVSFKNDIDEIPSHELNLSRVSSLNTVDNILGLNEEIPLKTLVNPNKNTKDMPTKHSENMEGQNKGDNFKKKKEKPKKLREQNELRPMAIE